ncbi:nucleolar and spindle-associated protein 1 [Solea senegalensis]|uniref:Nucleolar and spindle-associated protein 1 n=1 Tax=Solea senegalensis TaxID=28829 RepID=A0AAV6RYX0_SOLSE|nr:nucleolar and spindle-associated protein 1 isoform X1 [Solea senegalensis]KAG7510412.1 nucleolar and spindle-associated protein 1 [Solea senegalensis]
MDVDLMKYAELQKLAKELGLKANLKADKLLKLIKRHYQRETNQEEQHEQGQEKDEAAVQEEGKAEEDSAEENTAEAVPSTAVFVNTRRGRGNGTKRKISDTECDTKLTVTAVEDVTEVEASAPSHGARGAKKRKVSAVKDSTDNETESPEEPQQQEADVKDTAVTKAGKIPRHQGLLQKKKQLKPVTPNFKKLHEAHFNKMESIDSYVQRKSKKMETCRASAKELKKLPEKSKLIGKSQAKANQSRASMFSPILASKKPADDVRRHTLLSATKAPGKEDAPFRPSVLSTRRINVRFSEATHDNEYKRSLVKTPARMSPCVTSSTPKKQTAAAAKPDKPSTFSATKTPGPFVFTGNTSTSTTPGTQKTSFDLKASLSRPLTYKPHTGKLKPFGDTKENPTVAANKSLIANSHQKNYKQHQVQTREDRREKHAANRKQKKQNMLGARRGLVMM